MSQDTTALLVRVTIARKMATSPITARRLKSRRRVDHLEGLLKAILLMLALFLIPSQLHQGGNNHSFSLTKLQTLPWEVVPLLQAQLIEIHRLLPSQTRRDDYPCSIPQPLIPASCVRGRRNPRRTTLGRKAIQMQPPPHQIHSCPEW